MPPSDEWNEDRRQQFYRDYQRGKEEGDINPQNRMAVDSRNNTASADIQDWRRRGFDFRRAGRDVAEFLAREGWSFAQQALAGTGKERKPTPEKRTKKGDRSAAGKGKRPQRIDSPESESEAYQLPADPEDRWQNFEGLWRQRQGVTNESASTGSWNEGRRQQFYRDYQRGKEEGDMNPQNRMAVNRRNNTASADIQRWRSRGGARDIREAGQGIIDFLSQEGWNINSGDRRVVDTRRARAPQGIADVPYEQPSAGYGSYASTSSGQQYVPDSHQDTALDVATTGFGAMSLTSTTSPINEPTNLDEPYQRQMAAQAMGFGWADSLTMTGDASTAAAAAASPSFQPESPTDYGTGQVTDQVYAPRSPQLPPGWTNMNITSTAAAAAASPSFQPESPTDYQTRQSMPSDYWASASTHPHLPPASGSYAPYPSSLYQDPYPAPAPNPYASAASLPGSSSGTTGQQYPAHGSSRTTGDNGLRPSGHRPSGHR